MGSNRLFMAIAGVLVLTLLLGMLGIGGLVFLRYFAGPEEVALPPTPSVPAETPGAVDTATPTATSLPTATPALVATATLVVPAGTATGAAPEPGTQDGPGMSSPGTDTSTMPQSGLGPLEALGTGIAFTVLLAAVRFARRLRVGGRI